MQKPDEVETSSKKESDTKDIHTPLHFVRFEPYVIPKESLTGDTTERVDTRVLQVIYSFDRGDMPISQASKRIFCRVLNNAEFNGAIP